MHAPTNLAPAREEARDWSGWENWLESHLAIEREALAIKRETLIQALGEVLGESRFDLRNEIEAQVKALELKLAELRGAVDILRGAAPPPPAKFPEVEAWEDGVVYHEGDVVAFAGATYQARRDTAKTPGNADWTCLATAGRSVNIRGTYDSSTEYNLFDVVVCGGSSFIALKDSPGPCPSSGDWQLLAGRGSRGPAGSRGERGFVGPKGDPGQAAQRIQAWHVDHTRYVVQPIMTNGEVGPELQFRELFEQFLNRITRRT